MSKPSSICLCPSAASVSDERAIPSFSASMNRPQKRSISNCRDNSSQIAKSGVSWSRISFTWASRSEGICSDACRRHIPNRAILTLPVLGPTIFSPFVCSFDASAPSSDEIWSGTNASPTMRRVATERWRVAIQFLAERLKLSDDSMRRGGCVSSRRDSFEAFAAAHRCHGRERVIFLASSPVYDKIDHASRKGRFV